MPYTGTTFLQLRNQLAERLNDSGKVWTTDAELGLHIQDAIRFWNVLTGENRVNYNLAISNANPVWYDLFTITGSPRLCSLTDQDVYLRLTYALLEAPSPVAALSTAQFLTDDLVKAVQRKRDEFLFKTGCTSIVESLSVNPNQAVVALPQTVIEARRAYWIPNTIPGVVSNANGLFRNDEYGTASFRPFSPIPGQPICFSAGTIPPQTVQLIDPPLVPGKLEVLAVESQAALNPGAATTLLMPQDFVPGLLWGALADLLSMNMTAQDPARAALARQRFDEYVAISAAYPGVLSARVNNTAVFVDAVETLDIYSPTWRTVTANPQVVGLSGHNLVAFPSSQNMNIILFMIGNANVPALDNDFVQLGDEILDVILDEAQSTASFKMGGGEAVGAAALHGNIIKLGIEKNNKLRALSCFRDVLYGRVQRENQFAPLEASYDDQG